MYIYLRDNIVWEFIPEFNPLLPGVPVEERYAKDVVDALLWVDDVTGIFEGYIYAPETGEFSEPPERPNPEPEPDAYPAG